MSQAKPQKRKPEETVPVTVAKAPKCSKEQPPPAQWQTPDNDTAECMPTMKVLIPWVPRLPSAFFALSLLFFTCSCVNLMRARGQVRHKLVDVLKDRFAKEFNATGQSLAEMCPLQVQQGKSKDAAATSFKEMWQDASASEALPRHRMYEAGGSSFWVHTAIADPMRLDQQQLSFRDLQSLADAHWGAAAVKRGGWLVFPCTLHTFLLESEVKQGAHLKQPRALRLLSGHPVLLSWWLAMGQALNKGDFDKVFSLTRAALTATIHVKMVDSLQEAAKLAIDAAQEYKAHAVAMGENFLNWLLRFRIAQDPLLSKGGATYKDREHMADASQMKLQQDGKPVTLAAITAAVKISHALDDEALNLVQTIGREFGWKVLTDGYSKLQRIIYVVQRRCSEVGLFSAQGTRPLHFVLECILVALRRDMTSPSFYTTNTLGGETSKNAKPGFVDLALSKLMLKLFVETFISPLPTATKAELEEVLEPFQTPLRFHEAFPPTSGDQDEGNPLDAFVAGKNQQAVALAQLLHACHDGEHDENLLSLQMQEKPHQVLASPEDFDELKDLGLLKSLSSWMRDTEASTKVVSASAGADAASCSLRMLVRRASAEDREQAQVAAVKERQSAWKQASAARKKVCTFHVWKDAAAAQNIVNNRPFTPNAGEQHRLFVLSADLIQEADEKPWLHTCEKTLGNGARADQRQSALFSSR
ncbi:unnamed protein product [Effrenium voratum]|nr:unnamed protein product [Effrenium voratum]